MPPIFSIGHLRILLKNFPWLKLVFYPQIVTILASLLVACIVGITNRLSVAEVFSLIAVLWLFLHNVPQKISDLETAVLPLFPMLILLLFLVFLIRPFFKNMGLRVDRNQLRIIVAATIIPPLILALVSIVIINVGLSNSQVSISNPIQVFFYVFFFYLLALLVSYVYEHKLEIIDLVENYLGTPNIVSIVLKTIWFWIKIILVSLVILVILENDLIRQDFAHYGGILNMMIILILSIFYLPNILLWLIGLSTGAQLQAGANNISMFDHGAVQFPDLPIVYVLDFFTAQGYQKLFFYVPIILAAIFFANMVYAVKINKKVRTKYITVGAGITALLVAVFTSCLSAGNIGTLGRFGIVFPQVFVFTFAIFLLVANFSVNVIFGKIKIRKDGQ